MEDEMEKIRAPRGTADIYPPESARWQAFEARARALARRFGYGEIRTPMFEATELFVRSVGEATDIVEKEMYTFSDKSGRSLTLRPEWTAPVVRAMLEHNLLATASQRLFYVGPFFRYERPQAGRYRQANQFGVECFGFAGPEADVEVIALAHELLRTYELPGVALKLNSIGDACCRGAYREALLTYFRPHASELSADSQRRLERNPMRILDSKEAEDRALVAGAPAFLDHLCGACATHFRAVCALLESAQIPFTIEPRLVRGFDYYTRTVFEFVSEALGAQNTLCGGGRYDDLVRSLGGPPTPAVGFGLGIERFLMVVDAIGAKTRQELEGLAVIALGAAARERAVPLVAALRRLSGEVPVTIDYQDAKIAAQFKRAERAGARAALILGDDELARGEVVVRDLSARTQDTILTKDGDASTAASVLHWYRALPAHRAAEREAV
jgi:histidyl-tRNA synthetase